MGEGEMGGRNDSNHFNNRYTLGCLKFHDTLNFYAAFFGSRLCARFNSRT